MFAAILDTNVLLPSLQRNFLLSMAIEGLYRPLWSEAILEELGRHEARLKVKRGADPATAATLADRLIDNMRTHFDDAMVTGWEGLDGTYGLPATLTLPRRRDHLPAAVESAAYYVVTEAVTNVLKHAHAQTVAVDLDRAGDRLTIAVRDDGVGGVSSSQTRNGGLAGLADRIGALGGRFEVESRPDGGTKLLAEMPCA